MQAVKIQDGCRVYSKGKTAFEGIGVNGRTHPEREGGMDLERGRTTVPSRLETKLHCEGHPVPATHPAPSGSTADGHSNHLAG